MSIEEAARVRLGIRLRQIRTDSGRTLKEVAEHIGVSTPAMWRWEKGEARPRDRNLRAFAKYFNLSERELMSGTGEYADADDAEAIISEADREFAVARPALTDVIDQSKQRIAKVAGAVPAQIKIIIEV